MHALALAAPLFAAVAAADPAPETTGDDLLQELTLDDLQNTPISVASYRAVRLVASPGIVTVINRDEIERMGARDLIDILLLVPGFTFGQDVSGAVGVAFRGNWGHEGKVLLLWDGHEMNETLYATLPVGMHYPVALIDRIEIIRGPGSSLYGGYAELAVINVVTRSAHDLSGVAVSGEYGETVAGLGHRSVSLSAGQSFDVPLGGLDVKVDGRVSQANRSDGVYTDYLGNSFSLTNNAPLDSYFGNLRLRWGELSTSFMIDVYNSKSRVVFDELVDRPEPNNFLSLFADVRYDLRLFDRLTITPRLHAKRQSPWDSYGAAPENWDLLYYHKAADRVGASLTAAWDVVPGVNVAGGADFTVDHAALLEEKDVPSHTGLNSSFNEAGDDEVVYTNVATFGDALLETPLFNVAAGARFEFHSQYGPSFVPRVGVTKAVDKLHAKLLVEGAFKAPAIENIRLNPDVRPEKTRVFEGEVGYLLSDDLALSVNAFDITIIDPIVYFYDVDNDTEAYLNFPQTGSRGIEAELRLIEKWASVTLTWSLYTSEGKNQVPLYDAGRNDVVRGMPAHKLTAFSSFDVNEHVSVSPSLVWQSERYGFGGNLDRPIERLPPVLLVNIWAMYRDLLWPGLDVGVGVHNALGDDDRYVQPYDGLNSPLPGPSPELMLRVSYEQRIAM